MPRKRNGQLGLDLRTWGGKRRGAGRPPAEGEAGASHAAREEFTEREPVHVTLRMRDHVWNLRSHRAFRAVAEALARAQRQPGFAVAHYSVQGNHVHLLVEATGPAALGRGMRALTITLALGLNRLMGTRGPVLEGRYHAHVLRTPAEVRNALRYVVGNHASHARRRGEAPPAAFADPYSSAAAPFKLCAGQLELWAERRTSPAGSWLLRQADGQLNRR